MSYDILIMNAKTRSSGKDTVEIGIRGGKIADIGTGLSTDAPKRHRNSGRARNHATPHGSRDCRAF